MATYAKVLERRPASATPGIAQAAPVPTCRIALLLAGLFLLLAIATRVPIAPEYLFSFDTVNFALALDHFDPRLHQPQPPGYPMFVAEARLINALFHSPETTFLVCGLIASVLAPVLVFLLGARLFGHWAGAAAAALLFLNPVFWRTTLASPVRPYLAVISAAVAYCAYRAAAGEKRYLWVGALALGLGAGWRPAQLVLLTPLALVAAWRGTRSVRQVLAGGVVVGLATLLWLVPMIVVTSGPDNLFVLFARYLADNSEQSSPLFGGGFWGWWSMFAQGTTWLAMGIAPWAWAMPLLMLPRSEGEAPRPAPFRHSTFLLLWIVPVVLFYCFIHVAAAGHTLSAMPAFALLGGTALDRGAQRLARWLPRGVVLRNTLLAAALGVNFLLFIYPFRVPHTRPQVTGTAGRLREQFRFWAAYALHQGSFRNLRERSERTNDRIGMLRALTGAPGLAIVWQDDDVTWRKVTYYFSAEPVWVLEGLSGPNRPASPIARLWRGNRALENQPRFSPQPLRLTGANRVAWLLHLHSDLPAELESQGVPLKKFGALYLTDLAQAPAEFKGGGFLFRK